MKNLQEIKMVWNHTTDIANYDFADVVGYTNEEVREEVFRRFQKEIRKSTDKKLRQREAKKQKKGMEQRPPPKIFIKKRHQIIKD